MSYVGKVIGECTIQKQIGEGGGGMVFLGAHPEYGEKVVLKLLPRQTISDEQAQKRFEREIEMSIHMSHENIVKVYQASMDDEYYYIIMEFIDGKDIDVLMESKGILECDESVSIILQIAKALEYAHSKKIIHRDIKPSNILVKLNGDAKLCDFGLAKEMDKVSELTGTGMILGTPNFMSPEQWFGAKDLTPQSDIFSLGATFYYMITGKKPFEGDDATSIMSNSLFGALISPKDLNNKIPDRLSKVIEKMLARDLNDRYHAMNDVLQNLSSIKGKGSFLGRLFGGGK